MGNTIRGTAGRFIPASQRLSYETARRLANASRKNVERGTQQRRMCEMCWREFFGRTNAAVCGIECRKEKYRRKCRSWQQRQRASERTGTIYALYAPEVRRVKIGYTSQMETRIKAYHTHSPARLLEIAVIEGTRSEERMLHEELSRFEVDLPAREWFDATQEVMSAIGIRRLRAAGCSV